MIIHVVQPGETVFTIAQKYNIPARRLEQDNDLPSNNILNVGQALMILYPLETYIVQEGDTLSSIAESQGISLWQLLRNNPSLSSSVSSLYPGEELVINYETSDKKIQVNGYTSTYISREVLLMTLPFLTYITIYNFKLTPAGNFVDINDSEIIQLAAIYGVKPIMFLSSTTDQGKGSYGTTHLILNNIEIQDILINNIIIKLKSKGYYGLNLAFHSIIPDDMENHITFIAKVTERLNREGFQVFVSLTPSTLTDTTLQNNYYAAIGAATNNVVLMTYLWASAEIAQVSETTVNYLRQYLDYVVTQIPPEKIFIGLIRIAYDWELPYVPNDSIGRSLTHSDVIRQANQLDTTILFDEESQTPYFYYNDSGIEHYVWFKDARSTSAILNLVDYYGLKGIAIWNIMYYYPPTWLPINTNYVIDKIP